MQLSLAGLEDQCLTSRLIPLIFHVFKERFALSAKSHIILTVKLFYNGESKSFFFVPEAGIEPATPGV